MKHFYFLLFLASILLPEIVKAQINGIVVEPYYISDANDARETSDGTLPEGSVTYRIFIKLDAGVKLKAIYADANHALKIKSSEVFYNNARGKSFGKDISNLQLKRNTVALDTWLTLGLASSNHTGVLKSADPDTSILGGNKNLSNMLTADNPLAGIALVNKDGLVVKDNLSRNWVAMMDNVFYNAAEDTTIFGSIIPDSVFISNNLLFTETNGNVSGADNKILVAQLTTMGDLRFELNVEVITANGKTVKCVANNPQDGEVEIQYLTYPNLHIPVCGCPDPNYIEFDPKRERDSVGLCKTLIVLGCMDPISCNYNPEANMSDGLCCYPGNCANRDIQLVCPELGKNSLDFTIYPNPVNDKLNVEVNAGEEQNTKYYIVDIYGVTKDLKDLGVITTSTVKEVDVSMLPTGLYLIKIFRGKETGSKRFSKK